MVKVATSLFEDSSDDELDEPLLTAPRPEQGGQAQQHEVAAGESGTGADGEDIKQPAQDQMPFEVDDDDDDDDNKTQKTWGQFVRTFVVTSASVVAVAASGASMGILQTIPVYVMGGISCLIQPFVVVNEFRIAKKDTLRRLINKTRKQVNRLWEQNKFLTENIDELQREVDSAQQVERKLGSLAAKQQMNVDSLLNLVTENRKILAEMRAMVKSSAFQILISAIMISDKNRDFRIDEDELPELVFRLRQIEYLHFNEDKLKAAIRKNPTLDGILSIAQKLLNDDLQCQEDHGNIFTINCEKKKACETERRNIPERRKSRLTDFMIKQNAFLKK